MQCVEVTTPGRLDIDIMANNQYSINDRFWSSFIKHATDDQKTTLQKALADTGWSSHMMTVAKLID